MPKVIEFLGYNPIPCPEDLIQRLAWYKRVKGLTLEQLGAEMDRDPEQWVCDNFMGTLSSRCPMFPEVLPTMTQQTAAQGDNVVRAADGPVHT